MILQSATVTRIESLKATDMTPAVGELRTTDGEQFPIFDPDTLEAARIATTDDALVLLHLDESDIPPYHTYLRTLTRVDPHADDMPCPYCGYLMVRQGTPTRFGCAHCAHQIFLTRQPAFVPKAEPIARARLDVTTDGLFALDHMHKTATLMDTCASTTAYQHPNRGVRASLHPVAERSLPESWPIGRAYQRWMGKDVTLKLADGRTFEVV